MRNLIIIILILNFAFSKYLSFEEAVLKSPFKIANIGEMFWIPNSDSYIIRGKEENWNKWFKVKVPEMDTSLFFDYDISIYNEDKFYVDNITFSNNVQKALIKTDTEKIWRHSSFGSYYILNLGSKKIEPLTEKNFKLRNVKFSPNSKYVSYVRQNNNLYIYDIEKGKEKRLTSSGGEGILNGHFGWLYEEELTGFDGYRWSPDSKTIAFWEEDQSKVDEYVLVDHLKKYPIINKLKYPKVGEINPTLRIGVVRVNGGVRKWIDGAFVSDDYLPWMKWIDANNLSFLRISRDQKTSQLYIANRKTGKSKLILTEEDPEGWIDNHKQIYFTKENLICYISEKSKYRHIWMMNYQTLQKWQITSGDWEVKSILHLDNQNEKIFFVANKGSTFENKFFCIEFNGSNLKNLTKESGNHSVELTKSKRYFIDSYSSHINPKKIVLKKIDTGEIIREISKTKLDQFTKYEWSFPKIVKFSSLDKKYELNGIITLPPNYNPQKKYPLIIYGYGMPGTQIVWNKWGNIWNQFLAQQGYIIFSMDARGMGGRGENFKNYSYGDISKYLAKDHIAGIKYLEKNWSIDNKRIGAWGWSGGGYFTCLMLTRNGEYFKTGVAVAPCTDFELYDTAYTERFMGLKISNKIGYDSTNTLEWLHKMEGELLLIHGDLDDNVHYEHTLQFVNKALELDKEVDWLIYPSRDHGIYGNGSRKHLYKKMLDYFNLKL